MDKIYSRKRIRIPKFQNRSYKENKKIRKSITTASITCIAVVVFYYMLQSINPIIDTLCINKAKSIATIISNDDATKIMSNYTYDDIITIHKDEENNINMIESNIPVMNEIISDVGSVIQKDLDKLESEDIQIRLGSFTGSKILSGRGPKVPIRISSVGNIETNFRSQFKSEGINQTLHRVYLEVKCQVSILTPIKTIEEEITNQVILAENVIIGKIPQSYYNLDGLQQDQAMEVID